METHSVIWLLSAVSIAGLLWRPADTPEWSWTLAGGLALAALGLIPRHVALDAVIEGGDVYAFLVGMMLLSELARREGLFDFAAELAVRRTRGSARRLFASVYGVGVIVTVLLSNDATAIVLTPAVCAMCRRAGAKAMPHLFACAFVANAASFVLPISNPANLVVFGGTPPPLLEWIARFGVPSLASIVVTFATLGSLQRRALGEAIDRAGAESSRIGPGARDVAIGIGVTVVVLLVAGLERSGVRASLVVALESLVRHAPENAAWVCGVVVALASNLVNNLPAGLLAGSVVGAAQIDPDVRAAVAIGIDLGPNLSVTGSLATILWLAAIRREGERVGAWQFLRTGSVVMPLGLAAALGAAWLQGV